MNQSILSIIVYWILLIQLSMAAFDMNQANVSVWLSAAAACGVEKYETHVFQGPTTGFVVTHVINDWKATEGFVGYLPSDKSIYASFRGSSSLRNWITDARFLKMDYTSFPECNCQVHKGFYQAEQTVFSQVLSAVKKLRAQFPEYDVKVTGHSYGASIAQLVALDLIKHEVPVKSLYNFGQPRTGTKAYSDFTKTKMPDNLFRVVHNRDDVPHLPLMKYMDYYHVCHEVFEDENHQLKVCDDSCEDPTCADQFKALELNGDDHMHYLGIYMTCEGVSAK